MEVIAIEEAANLTDALCSIDEKYVDKLGQRLGPRHNFRDHLEASRIDRDGGGAIAGSHSWSCASSDKPRGHVVEPREELHIVDWLRQVVVHLGGEVFFFGSSHRVSGQGDDRHGVLRRRQGADAFCRLDAVARIRWANASPERPGIIWSMMTRSNGLPW